MIDRRAVLGLPFAFLAARLLGQERHNDAAHQREELTPLILQSARVPMSPDARCPFCFLPLLGIAFGLIKIGYDIPPASEMLANAINGVQEQLRRIADSIQNIQKDIDQIVDLLKNLPAEIAEIIDNNAIKSAIVQAVTASEFLADRTQSSQGVHDNLSRIEDKLYDVELAINTFLVYRGVTGVMLAAPYIPTYVQTFTILQRYYREHNHYAINPYKSAFHQQSVVAPLKKLYEYDAKFRDDNRDYFLGQPKENFVSTFNVPSGLFPNTDIDFKCGYSGRERGAQPNLFGVIIGSDTNPAMMGLLSTGKRNVCMPRREWGWNAVTSEYDAQAFPDPPTVLRAFRSWQTIDKAAYLKTHATARDFSAPLALAKTYLEERVFNTPPEWQHFP